MYDTDSRGGENPSPRADRQIPVPFAGEVRIVTIGPWTVEWVDEIDSTNSHILRHFDEVDNMSVLSARSQTAGRGQRGNRWLAQEGVNLTFSIVLRPGQGPVPPLQARSQFPLSELASLSVVQTLEHYGISSTVKWPNDVYIGDRKVCGMLIENRVAPVGDGSLELCVVGIGLNVNQRTFDPALVNPVSMASCPEGAGRTFDTGEVLAVLLSRFADNLALASRDRWLLHGLYLRAMYRLGRWYEYTDCSDGEVFEGMIVGCTEDGYLRVRKRNGEERSFAFKEISYII